MSGLHLITGYQGKAHITSADQGGFNAYTFGTGEYVLTMGRRFEPQIISNNLVRIHDGCLMMNGRYVALGSGEYIDVNIGTGTQGMKRNDIIYVRYEMNYLTGVESVSLNSWNGTAVAGTPTDPTLEFTDTILNGASYHDMPLYRVRLNGLTLESIEPLFQVLAPMSDIQHGFYKQNMLINGDFQCNQRSKKTYEVTGSTEVAYSVDMWRIHKLKLEVLNEGVKITGNGDVGYLTQFIQLGKLKTTTYTISAMIDEVIYSYTITPGGTAKEKDFGKFKISALTTSAWDNALNDYNNKLKINICPIGTGSFVLKYVDVFEGTVAYPHVKEDPATALVRCRRYIQRGCSHCPVSSIVYDKTDGILRFGIPFSGMAVTPTVVACSWSYSLSDSNRPSGSLSDLTYVTTHADGLIEYTLPTTAAAPTSFGSYAVRATYVVSCEHNPNGD